MMKGKHRPHRAGNSGAPRSGSDRPRTPTPPPRRPEPRAGKGGTWLYGIHPVLAALANPSRRIARILITPDAMNAVGHRIAVLAESRPGGLIAPLVMDRAQIEKQVPRGAVHQGLAVEVDGLEQPDIDDICRAAETEAGGRVVVLDQVTDPHNVGAVLRSAAAFGAAAVIAPERHAPGASGVMAKAASGALERVPLIFVVNLSRALDRLKQAGFWCVGLDAGATTPIQEADLSGRIALVLGAEGQGLRRLTREHCDMMVRIPIAAGIDSLNVSNAAAVALYEFARRG